MPAPMDLVLLYWLTAALYTWNNIVEGKSAGNAFDNHGVEYLKKFGYVPPTFGQAGAAHDVTDSLRAFQKFARLNVTGKFDEATIKKMKAPRCGDKDLMQFGKRRKRYVLEGSTWKKKDLTYRIVNDPYSGPTNREVMTPELISKTIKAAFQRWSFVTDLTFTELKEGVADIMIKFARGKHGDKYDFDGRGNALAHAFYPNQNTDLAGDAHFDADEKFSLTEEESTNFLWVTLHEFGHSLGLKHSPEVGAVMHPWYTTGEMGDVRLSKDDKHGIQALYGRNQGRSKEKRIVLPEPPRKECKYSFNAFFHDKRNKRMFAFKDHEFYILSQNKESKEPRRIVKRWKGLTTRVKAAYTRNDGYTIFFTRHRFYKYDGTQLDEGPTNIEKYGLPKELRDMDAALSFPGNDQTYFFKQDKYWRYDQERKKIAPGYPKLIKTFWRGVPDSIDAALQTLEGDTYFFKGPYYYKFNHFAFSVLPGYPKPIGPNWLGCKEEESSPDIVVLSRGGTGTLRPSYIAILLPLYGLLFAELEIISSNVM